MGLIVGNVVLGPSQDIYNTTAIVFGVAAVALFILHGAAFLSDKKAPFILTSVAIIASAIVLSIISFPESFGTTSSYLTLKTMLILALIGMPFVVAYTVWAYVVLKRPAKNSLY
jgi:cytochrome bd-type quinol oxidase subunit 2